jgi:cell wall-associated protease
VQSCTSVNLAPDFASPNPPGTTVTFTATALGCNSPTYQYLVLAPGSSVWVTKQPFGPLNTYAWNTTGFTPGTWQIGVWARQTGSTAHYQSYAFVTYQLIFGPGP